MQSLYKTSERETAGLIPNRNDPNVWERYSQNSDSYAEDVYTDLVREEYKDYDERFKPFQQRYVDVASSTELLDEQLSRINATAKSNYQSADLNKKMNLARYGVTQNQAQQNVNAKQSDMNQALSIASAKNSSRIQHKDRQMAMVTGGPTPTIKTDINNGAASSGQTARG